jgi:hypothetical protein
VFYPGTVSEKSISCFAFKLIIFNEFFCIIYNIKPLMLKFSNIKDGRKEEKNKMK